VIHFGNIPDDLSFLIDDEIAGYGSLTNLAHRLNEAAANWTTHGDLDFLNNW
jgi:hypothetical protein